MATETIPTAKLSNGVEMPVLGFGVFQIPADFQRTAEQRLMSDHGVQIESWGPFAEGRNNLFTDPTLTEIGVTASPPRRSFCVG